MTLKKMATSKASSPRKQLHDNSRKGQCLRLERALRDNPGGLTTIELVEDFDIMRPSARVSELRWDKGLNIQTINTLATTAQGHVHQNARYVLHPGEWKGGKS
jgi:hypothetical protein